jgi:hypothetical protein
MLATKFRFIWQSGFREEEFSFKFRNYANQVHVLETMIRYKIKIKIKMDSGLIKVFFFESILAK